MSTSPDSSASPSGPSTPNAPSPAPLARLSRHLLWLLLGCLMIAVPLSMIARKEYVLRQGEILRFRLAPVDPGDPFRGRFMTLSFEVERKKYVLPPDDGDPGTPQVYYAVLARDAEGYASIDRVEASAPLSGVYLRLVQPRNYGAQLTLPFNRYYMNEERAAAVENQARELIRTASAAGKPNPIYAEVRIKDGEGVIIALKGPDGPLSGAAAK